MQKLLSILLLLFLSFSVTAQNMQSPAPASSLSLHLKLSNMSRASAPEIWGDYFILSYQARRQPRFVAVAFEHEEYQILHKFLRNEQDVFIFYSNLPDVQELNYRIIVDGVWQADPMNPNIQRDSKGVEISTFSLPQQRAIIARGPIYRGNGIVDFYLSARPEASVFLVGDFSRWDPFLLPMKEVENGVYHLRIYLNEGEHHYYFLVNGSRMTDPGNFMQKEFLGESISAWRTPDSY